MSKSQKQATRRPATKFAPLQKKMQKQKVQKSLMRMAKKK
jgi:hypothetical protein